MSFGSGFGGFGQNNQQQQPSTGFGGFGQNNQTTGGFGSTNTGFGATNNNAGGSLFGGGNTTGTTGGFGSTGFGSTSTPPKTGFGSSGGGLFGGGNTTTPTTGFGGFGSTANNTQSTGFGSSTTGGGLFGQQNPAPASTGFGASSTTGGGLFGSAQPSAFGQTGTTTTPGFGQTTTTPGFGQAAGQPPQNNGTGATPFQPHTERDPGSTGTGQQYFQNIVCQQPYTQFSQEELRSVDYVQGRKHGNQNGQGGAFGQSTGFGGFGSTTNNNTTTPGFGASTGGGLFGQQNQQNTSTGFGQQNTSNPFGSSTGGGLFGAKPATTGGLFGNSTPATSGTTGGGLFGTSGTTGGFGSSTGGFGSTANNNTTGSTLFGNTQNQAKPGGLFGSTNNTGFGTGSTSTGFGQQNNTSGGLFGNSQNNAQPSTGFGQQNQTSNPFGGFGQSQNNQNQSGSSLFGQNNTNNAFGQQNQAKPGGLFGNNTTTTGTSGGLFGQTQQQQQQPQQQSGGLFGNTNTSTTGGGLFGNQQNQQKPGGLFGNSTTNTTNTGGGLFGNSFGQNNQNQQNQSGGLFGNTQNQNKSLFGNTTNNTTGGSSLFGGSFGQNNQQNQQQNSGSSLFGQPQQNQQQPQMGNSLFGNTQQQQTPQQPQYLTTSINSETPYGNDQLFMSLNTPQQSVGPLVTPLSSSQKPRQRAPLPAYRLNPAASSRLITPQKRNGFGFDYSTYGTPGSAYSNASPAYGRSLLGGGSLNRSLNKSMSMNNMRASYNAEDSILAPGAFSAGGIRGGGSGSLKKLKINRSLRTDLFGADGSNDRQASPLKKRVSFEGESERDKADQPNGDASNALVRRQESDSPTPSAEEQGYLRSSRNKTSSVNGAPARKEMEQVRGNELAVVPENDTPSPPPAAPKPAKTAAEIAKANQKDMEPGSYYMIPSRADIEKMSRKERANISPFTVGREHAGKIDFDRVDLSNVDLDKIGGDIVRLDVRIATVYADHGRKPEPGNELNFPAKVTLENSWPRSKGGKLPVYERKGPRFEKHIERLRRVKETEFIKYDVENGLWIFRVEHFSTYTFDYSDDESTMLSPAPSSRAGGRSGLMPRDSQQSQQSQQEDGYSSNASSRRSSQMDDTFEFKNSKSLPGAFEGDVISDDEMHAPNEDDTQHDSFVSGSQDQPLQSIEYQGSSVFDDAPMANGLSGMDGAVDNLSPQKQPFGNVNLISPIKFTPMKPGRSILKAVGGTPQQAGKSINIQMNWAEQLQRTLSPKKQDRHALRQSQSQRANGRPATMSSLGGFTKESHPFATSIDVMNSLFGNKQAVSGKTAGEQVNGEKSFQVPNAKRQKKSETEDHDTDAALCRAFRPSWTTDTSKSHAELYKQTFGTEQEETPRTLHILRKAADISIEEGVAFAQASNELVFLDFSIIVKDQEEQRMWELATILFDRPEDDDITKLNDEISDFWEQIVAPVAQQQISDAQKERTVSPEELAILKLSRREVWAAAEALSAGKDFSLSTMIAQLGADDGLGDGGMRKMIADQIEEWRESNTLSEISPAVRALYELLAGNTCTSTGKTGSGPENRAETFNISARFGLDWRRAFALRLWYCMAGSDTLAKVVDLYARDVTAHRETVRPVSWFVQQKANTGWSDPQQQDRQDILYGLLKIFASGEHGQDWLKQRVKLADIIAPQNLAGTPWDARLSFQLYQTLRAQGIIDFSDDEDECRHRADILTTDYAFQLSGSAHALIDAIFVTLHLHDPKARKAGIQALLNHYAAEVGDGPDKCPIFGTLVKEMKIPASWIWTAKALHARTALRSDVKECRFLLAGGDKMSAHAVFVDKLAPRCIIEEDRRTISEVLDLFKTENVQLLNQWSSGGSVYADYLKIMHVAEKGGNAEEALGIAQDVGQNLAQLQKSSSLNVRVSATEMASDIERAAEGFARRLGREETNVLKNMPMQSDEVLKRVEEMSTAYYKALGVY